MIAESFEALRMTTKRQAPHLQRSENLNVIHQFFDALRLWEMDGLRPPFGQEMESQNCCCNVDAWQKFPHATAQLPRPSQ